MMSRKALLILLLLTTALGFAPRQAMAATSCSATMTGLSFGTVVPSGGAVTATATISWSCTYSGGVLGILYGDFIQMCFGAGSGSGGTSLNPRQMAEASSGEAMSYNLYKDAGYGTVWATTPTSAQLGAQTSFTILANPTTRTGTITIYGRVPAGQTSLGVGSYSSSFGGTLNYQYAEVLLSLGGYPPSTCGSGTGSATGSGTGSFSFTVNASVASSCTAVSGSTLDFGTQGLLTGNVDQTSTISLTCTKRSPYNVGLDAGVNAVTAGDIGTRRMSDGASHYIGYQMYRDAGRSNAWGNTIGSNTVDGSAVGGTQTFTVYGRVPPQAPRAGTYTDTVTVTVTY